MLRHVLHATNELSINSCTRLRTQRQATGGGIGALRLLPIQTVCSVHQSVAEYEPVKGCFLSERVGPSEKDKASEVEIEHSNHWHSKCRKDSVRRYFCCIQTPVFNNLNCPITLRKYKLQKFSISCACVCAKRRAQTLYVYYVIWPFHPSQRPWAHKKPLEKRTHIGRATRALFYAFYFRILLLRSADTFEEFESFVQFWLWRFCCCCWALIPSAVFSRCICVAEWIVDDAGL